MKPVKYNLYIARILRVAVTVLLFWFIVTFVQIFALQMVYLFIQEDAVAAAEMRNRLEDFQRKQHRSSKEVLADGSIHLVCTKEYSRAGQGYNEKQVFDVNGNLIWEGQDKDKPYEYLRWTEYPRNSFNDHELIYMQYVSPDLSRVLDVPVNSNRRTEEIWRYDIERQIFRGYGRQTNVVGYIGADGFADSLSEAVGLGSFRLLKLCEDSGINPVFLWQTDNRIYEINFESGQVRIIFESPADKIDMIRLSNWGQKRTGEPAGDIEYRPLIFCRTADNVYYLIMREPEQVITIDAFKNENPDSYYINATATNEGVFVLYRERGFVPPDGISQKELLQYRQEFMRRQVPLYVELYKVDGSNDINVVSRFDWVKPAVNELEWTGIDFYERYRKITSSVSPVAYDLLWWSFEDGMLRLTKRDFGITGELADITSENRAGGNFINLSFGALMVVFAFWHGWSRRTSWGKFIFWLVFVGLFNLAGLLTYLALNHTVVIKCPVCGKRRGMQIENCIRCKSQLPVPGKKELDLILGT